MHYISLLGLAVMIGLAWLMSSHKKRFPVRVVLGGLVLQFVFALVILRTTPGEWIFDGVNTIFVNLLDCVGAGSEFVFGAAYTEHFFAFKVLPTIFWMTP